LIQLERRIASFVGGYHRPELFPDRNCGSACQDNAAPGSEGSDHGPKPYLLGLWIIGLLGLCAPIAGIAVYQIDKRRPHTDWITVLPLILFAILAVAGYFQLHVLANAMEYCNTTTIDNP
jgi:hypothetical protein